MKYSTEKIKDTYIDLLSLVNNYWEEVDERREEVDVNIDLDSYLKLEELGMAYLVTARDSDSLVGFIIYMVSPCLHTSSTKVICEILYVTLEHRGSSVASSLVGEMEQASSDDSLLFFTLKTEFPHNELVKHLGYSHVENVYMKRN